MVTRLAVAAAVVCWAWSPPVPGPIIAGYSVVGEYQGHFGVDYLASFGSPVRAPIVGVVSFAGSVAGMRTVTIRSGDIRFSLSYLSVIMVEEGEMVARGAIVGESGIAHGREAVHMSVRVGERYVDPNGWCPPSRARLRLLPDE